MRERALILLVDDEDEFLEIASAKLQAEHFETVLAHGFYDALEKAELLMPDLILSDIFMPPGPSGWELALALRRNPKTRDIKFAFFTSLRDPWAELAAGKRTAAKQILENVTILSKTDGVNTLAKDVERLIRG